MYLFTTPSLPTISLPSRERLQRVWSASIAALLWAIAISYTAGKLTRRGWEAIRPGLAKLLHGLAIAMDGSLLYPDQPEPDPTPDPTPDPDPEMTALRAALDGFVPLTASHLELCQALAPNLPCPAPAAAKPRAARRRKAPAKAAAEAA